MDINQLQTQLVTMVSDVEKLAFEIHCLLGTVGSDLKARDAAGKDILAAYQAQCTAHALLWDQANQSQLYSSALQGRDPKHMCISGLNNAVGRRLDDIARLYFPTVRKLLLPKKDDP